jgi:2-(1,2-epoxy-1,2-dihydrophenyl)acetyl-CoA isomerase
MSGSPASTDELGLRREVRRGVLWIEIDRPQVGNALTVGHHAHLGAWFHEASTDPAVRAVVLIGAGERFFCTGADLRVAAPKVDPDAPRPARPHGSIAAAIADGWQATVAAITACDKPVIAGLNGTAAGAGLHLALACDLVVAASHAKLVEVFVRRGICPDGGGAYLLTSLVGPQRAKELMFFGDDVPADDALRMGLVNRVVPGDELRPTVEAWAERLAQGPTRAIAAAKSLVNRALDDDRAASFWQEAWAQEALASSHDAQEGLRAFAEGRPPSFTGG